MEAGETFAGVVSVSIDAECVCSTNGVRFALVNIWNKALVNKRCHISWLNFDVTSALDTSVSFESLLTLAHVVSWKIATLRVLHALGGVLGDLALVNVCE